MTPPEEIQHAVEVLGAEIGATIFDELPRLSREQFRARVDFLIQHQFGETFLQSQSARARFAHDQLLAYAAHQYERLGGVWREPPGHGKQKRHRSRRQP